eukprot:39776-Eustigmatos_ZCMA.PRE.1
MCSPSVPGQRQGSYMHALPAHNPHPRVSVYYTYGYQLSGPRPNIPLTCGRAFAVRLFEQWHLGQREGPIRPRHHAVQAHVTYVP